MRGAFLLAGILACVVTAGVVAQQRLTDRTSVDLVLIDVNVVDRSGTPVGDLTASDFTVNVDRKPRKIVTAQFLRYDARNAAAPASPSAAKPAPPPVPAAPRDVLLVIDEDTLETGDALGARKAAEKFIDALPAIDRVGVVAIPRLPSHITLTSNRSEVRKALGVLNTSGVTDDLSGRLSIGLSEAFEIEKNDGNTIERVVLRECKVNYRDATGEVARQSGSAGECIKEVFRQAHTMALAAHAHGQQRLDALCALATELSRLPGRKTMVLISGGFAAGESTTPFSTAARVFAASEVSLYTIYVERSQFGQVRHQLSPSAVEDQRVQGFGVENMTSAAGGTLLLATGSVGPYFDRVVTELTGAYLLSIEVTPGDRDGKLHFVDVTVNRPSVEVRARKQYMIKSENAVQAAPEEAPVPPVPTDAKAKPTPPARPIATDTAPSSELQAILARATAYVGAYENQFSGLVAEERYDQRFSKIAKSTTIAQTRSKGAGAQPMTLENDKYEWELQEERTTKSDYLLVKAPGGADWIPFRDVFEVDGQKLRDRENRLQKLFLEQPQNVSARAAEILRDGARYNIGFVERNMNVPTLALAVLEDANRARFTFKKRGERTIEGVKTWEIAYNEHGSPTLIRGDGVDIPAEGVLWVDPQTGTVLQTTLQLNLGKGVTHEVSVTYKRTERAASILVPAEMREVITAPDAKLECRATYSNIRRFQVSTDVQIPKAP